MARRKRRRRSSGMADIFARSEQQHSPADFYATNDAWGSAYFDDEAYSRAEMEGPLVSTDANIPGSVIPGGVRSQTDTASTRTDIGTREMSQLDWKNIPEDSGDTIYLSNPMDPSNTGRFTSKVGASRDGGRRSHAGVDFWKDGGAMSGLPIYAAHAGKVTIASGAEQRNGGITQIEWQTSTGRDLGNRYIHMVSVVKAGDSLQAGDLVGYITSKEEAAKYGSNLGSGPHLHFETFERGRSGPPIPTKPGSGAININDAAAIFAKGGKVVSIDLSGSVTTEDTSADVSVSKKKSEIPTPSSVSPTTPTTTQATEVNREPSGGDPIGYTGQGIIDFTNDPANAAFVNRRIGDYSENRAVRPKDTSYDWHEDITATTFAGPNDKQDNSRSGYTNTYTGDAIIASLPARVLRDDSKLPSVEVFNPANGKTIIMPVGEVGPWNVADRQYIAGGRPQVESGYNMRGRKATNDAGIDFTPRAMSALGLRGKGKVHWRFVDEKGYKKVGPYKENVQEQPKKDPTPSDKAAAPAAVPKAEPTPAAAPALSASPETSKASTAISSTPFAREEAKAVEVAKAGPLFDFSGKGNEKRVDQLAYDSYSLETNPSKIASKIPPTPRWGKVKEAKVAQSDDGTYNGGGQGNRVGSTKENAEQLSGGIPSMSTGAAPGRADLLNTDQVSEDDKSWLPDELLPMLVTILNQKTDALIPIINNLESKLNDHRSIMKTTPGEPRNA